MQEDVRKTLNHRKECSRNETDWKNGPNSKEVSRKKMLQYLKRLCEECGFRKPWQYKLHTFRHFYFFAGYCAQQNMSYKYALEWMGHSSSAILDIYFTMNDQQAQTAMNSMRFEAEEEDSRTKQGQSGTHFETALPQTPTL